MQRETVVATFLAKMLDSFNGSAVQHPYWSHPVALSAVNTSHPSCNLIGSVHKSMYKTESDPSVQGRRAATADYRWHGIM